MGNNNPVFTRQVAEYSLDRVKDLKALGFLDSPLYFDAFSRSIQERGISVMERIMIIHLIKKSGRIAGAAGFSIDATTVHIFLEGFEDHGDQGGSPGADDHGGRPPRSGGPEEGGAPAGMGGNIAGGSSAGMSIHKSEGLVPINADGASNIPRLYAAGDALGSSYGRGHLYPNSQRNSLEKAKTAVC